MKFCRGYRLLRNSRSQASLEFLTTYAWAFVIISVSIGALYYFGVLDFNKYLPQKCTFTSQFKCLDFSLKSPEVRVRLINNLGEDVQVTSVQITNDATTPISCIPPTPFTWASSAEQELLFTACSGGGFIAGARVELKISMDYYAINTPSHPIHLINGKVNGQVG